MLTFFKKYFPHLLNILSKRILTYHQNAVLSTHDAK
nr:MAG TPA_asm: hypothetical protein [Caudoviricetes sp.]